MENHQTTAHKETDDGQIIGNVTQPLEKADQADRPVSPDEKVIEEMMQQGRDSIIRTVMGTVKEIDDRIFKINERIHKPIPGAQWLSTDAEGLRDRLVEAKKPIVQMLKDMTEPESNIEGDEVILLVRFWAFLAQSHSISLEADRFLGKQV
ncbi:hypothetical protein B0J15DRAFT_554238 [Fusarium solani]|uniref:Uncharacterized protein n=1 Tax=Fusarium solani TaxID=169388 RepID=A0A9P9GE32_FUSSL|nr:uncharacterized protein B0J15DRAFT_554238 [Fusarium solani]KAH7237361.1 hypothetical protein B0J15DRAFT_554238 [Fusarium solani]